jgi:hypothetical protein
MALPTRWLRLLRGMIALSILAAGCTESAHKELVPVKGKILNGAGRLTGALLTFHPDPAEGERGGAIAMGKVQADGTYELVTGDKPGATTGRYRVTVTLLRSPDVTAGPILIPPIKYLHREQTDLVVEVSKEPRLDQYDLRFAE